MATEDCFVKGERQSSVRLRLPPPFERRLLQVWQLHTCVNLDFMLDDHPALRAPLRRRGIEIVLPFFHSGEKETPGRMIRTPVF